MLIKPILAVFSLGSLAASAQPSAASARFSMPGFDAARIGFTQTGDSDFDDDDGSFSLSRLQAMSAISRPISPVDGLSIIPFFDYKLTNFNFDDTPNGYPFRDEDLHSLSLSTYVISMREGSPWIYGGWARAEMATDFDEINSDSFTFDIAAGVGYRFNDCFMLGIGGAAINLNGDTGFYPGINFYWTINEQISIGLYGPTFVAAWNPSEDWLISFREDPLSGTWNIRDDSGESRSIDFTSFRLGLYVSRRLTGDIWLSAGAGVTVGNELDYTTPSGDVLVERDADSGTFATIALRVKSW